MTTPITFRPLTTWPRAFTKSRRHSTFMASYQRTLEDLDRELCHLRARSVVIQLAVPEGQIRRDGMPYADAKPAHPGIILAFEKHLGGRWLPMQMPCDTFLTWEDNLRAIALSLEALRRVDRYGVTSHAEQYRGWAALPGPIITPAKMDLGQAVEFLARTACMERVSISGTVDGFRNAYRRAALKLHPDANNGQQHPDWLKLQEAAEVLRRHHGIRE